MENPASYAEVTDHNAKKLGAEVVQVGDLRLIWRARSEKTGFQFEVYDMELPPLSGGTEISRSNEHQDNETQERQQ